MGQHERLKTWRQVEDFRLQWLPKMSRAMLARKLEVAEATIYRGLASGADMRPSTASHVNRTLRALLEEAA